MTNLQTFTKKNLYFELAHNSEPGYRKKSIRSNKYTSFMGIYNHAICKEAESAKETLYIFLKATI